MRIISKYVLKEHVGPLVFALSALTSLLLLNYIAKQFEKLVGKGLPWTVIGEFFLLSIPFTVAMTLPMAVLVSTLYAFSRLAAENEVTALKASGVSMTRVLTPVLIGATVLAGLMVWFNDRVLPSANHRLAMLQQDIARVKPTFALRERVFNEVSPGRFYLQANHVDQASGLMREITIHDLSNPAASRTIHADSGRMGLTDGQTDLVLTLFDGYLNEIPKREEGQFQRHFFREDRIRVRGVGNQLTRSEGGGYKGDREMSICEMQASVNTAHSEYMRTREELANVLGHQARAAVTGVEEDPASEAGGFVARAGLGQAYCRMIAALPFGNAPPRRPPPSAGLDGSMGMSLDDGRIEDAGRRGRRLAERPDAPVVEEMKLDAPDVGEPVPPVAMPGPLPAHGGVSAEAAAQADSLAAQSPIPPARLVGNPVRARALTSPAMVGGRIEALRSQMEINAQTVQRYDVEIQKKFALAVACVVFVLLGAPVALRFPRGGVGMALGVSLGVFAIYYVGLIGGEALADRGLLTPFWAMWAANVIFTFVGLLLLARMGREGATARGGDFGEMRDAVRSWFARQGRRVGLPLERRRTTR